MIFQTMSKELGLDGYDVDIRRCSCSGLCNLTKKILLDWFLKWLIIFFRLISTYRSNRLE